MPLTITILVLVVFANLCRRYIALTATVETLGRLLRTTVTFALLAMGLTFFGHTSSSEGGGHVSVGASPGAVFGWALVLTSVVGLLVVLARPEWQRVGRDERAAGRLQSWRLPIEGGLAALVASVVVGGAVFIVVLLTDTTFHASPVDVARVLPLIIGFYANIGVAITAVSMGANVGLMGSGVDSQASLGYAHLHGLSNLYFLLLLLPVVSTAAGIVWMLHRRRDEDDRDMSRACYRMAASYAVGWAILATFSRISFGAGIFGGGHAGPQILLGFGLSIGWVTVVGAAAGQWLLRSGMPRVQLRVPVSPPRLGSASPLWPRLSLQP